MKRAQLPPRAGRGGFVLMLVLGILILLTLLVVGFLGHTLSQTKSATSYSAQTGSLLLSDVAVNLVKSQIDDATAVPGTSLWASQPGAIRVLDHNGTQTLYKLYSSSTLTKSDTAANLQAQVLQDIPAAPATDDWTTSPLWTDLNAPAVKSDGTYAYPIIDVVNDNADLPTGGTSAAPFATGSFNIDSSTGTNPVGATRMAATGATAPLPMPVRWLYVLKQGQIIVPDAGGTGTTVTFNSAATVPTTANPIVGRIAYWTDDDTCRVNINTAAHGTFWDTPRFTSQDDYLLGLNQPLNKEYQRYSGHPATTTLALALPEFATGAGRTVTSADAEALYALAPRYNGGGSIEGTVPAASASAIALPKYTPGTNPPTPYRLFSSVNELLFSPPGMTAGSRVPSASRLNQKQVETAKFFLTAHSRAPELNLFGEPRVAIWPVSSVNDAQHRTASDQLIAFCATTPGTAANTYYFTRQPYTVAPSATGSNSTSADVSLPRNLSLLGYLDNLTSQPLPGNLSQGTSFDSKYTPNPLGMRQILTEIFDYIRITNARDPGLDPAVPGSPAGAVPYAAATAWDNTLLGNAGVGQVVPTIMTNAIKSGWAGTYGFGRYQGRIVEASIIFVGVGRGIPSGTVTYVPQPTPPWVAVNSAQAGLYAVPYTGVTPAPAGTGSTLIPPPGMTAVQPVFVLNFFDPASGFSRALSSPDIATVGLTTGFQANGPHLFRNECTERLGNFVAALGVYSTYMGANPASLGGLMDFRIMLGGRMGGQGVGDNQYDCMGTIVNLPTGGTFAFTGGTLTVYMYGTGAPIPTPAGATSNTIPLVHSFTITFPDAPALPVPGLSDRPILGTNSSRGGTRSYPNSLPTTTSATTDRFDDVKSTSVVNGEQDCHLIDFANDTVISMVPSAAYGDYRMLCAPTTPAAAFTSLYLNLTTTQKLGYGFRYPSGQVFPNAVYGNLVSGIPSSSYTQQGVGVGVGLNPPAYGSIPFVPWTVQYPSAGSALSGPVPPDFDNGFGELPDGPFINKPDEGAVYPSGANRVYYDNLGSVVDVTASPAFFFSPQRQVPSPVMFGSLPTGAPLNGGAPKPWQTLLFQPGMAGHAGLQSPKDEYLLDLFWMPQAEPYAISEPFSTAGKINLNYQILPFTYIDRSTAIQSVLASEMVAQVAATKAGSYKKDTAGNTVGMGLARQSLNMSEVDGTLRQFAAKFQAFDFFKTAAEICDIYLVPQNESWTSDSAAQAAWYGSNYALVGDNTRERPYADIYSRLTTQSNTFTVYYRVQTLKNKPGAAFAAQWTEGQGAILGDYRGSTTLEHYIDPNDTTVPDYATAAAGIANLETHYKWRVVENNRFAP